MPRWRRRSGVAGAAPRTGRQRLTAPVASVSPHRL